jgi:RNA polymerase sigma-70 factor (ECF subfamily)
VEPTDLGALLDRCRNGDDLAWEAFVHQFQRRIYAISRAYAADADEAADLAQDIFVRLYETRGRWAPADVFTAWMVRVARNLCLDAIRRKKARPPARDVPADEMLDLTDPRRTPDSALEASRDRQLVWRALRSLSHISREAILLKEIQGFSLEEIAGMLRAPLGTVKSRVSRARLELAEQVLRLDASARPGPLA